MTSCAAHKEDPSGSYGCLKCGVIFSSKCLFFFHPCCDAVREQALQRKRQHSADELKEGKRESQMEGRGQHSLQQAKTRELGKNVESETDDTKTAHKKLTIDSTQDKTEICTDTLDSPLGCQSPLKRNKLATLKKYKCSKCSAVFRSKLGLQFHIRLRSCEPVTDAVTWTCTVCSETFPSTIRKSHMETHRNLPCPECKKLFFNKRNLREHWAACSKRFPTRKYVCEVCGSSFLRISNLHDHKRKVHSARPSKCQKCGKLLKNAVSLKVHMKTHYQRQEYQCKQCQKVYLTKSHFQKHFQMHQESAK